MFDNEETYIDRKVDNVWLSNDPDMMGSDEFDSLCAALSSEVITYNINEVK